MQERSLAIRLELIRWGKGKGKQEVGDGKTYLIFSRLPFCSLNVLNM